MGVTKKATKGDSYNVTTLSYTDSMKFARVVVAMSSLSKHQNVGEITQMILPPDELLKELKESSEVLPDEPWIEDAQEIKKKPAEDPIFDRKSRMEEEKKKAREERREKVKKSSEKVKRKSSQAVVDL